MRNAIGLSTSMDGQPRSYTLRATQDYRREGGDWKVAHRHAEVVCHSAEEAQTGAE
jgi:ketosteroid isomerase-like protein